MHIAAPHRHVAAGVWRIVDPRVTLASVEGEDCPPLAIRVVARHSECPDLTRCRI